MPPDPAAYSHALESLLAEHPLPGGLHAVERRVEDLLTEGYISALALESTRRGLRERVEALAQDGALGASERREITILVRREAALLAQERELRGVLDGVRERWRAARQVS
jgi:hypothetical protein